MLHRMFSKYIKTNRTHPNTCITLTVLCNCPLSKRLHISKWPFFHCRASEVDALCVTYVSNIYIKAVVYATKLRLQSLTTGRDCILCECNSTTT